MTPRVRIKLSAVNEAALFCGLPMRLDLDSEDIDYALVKLGVSEVDDGNFGDVYNAVRRFLLDECYPAPARTW
jgi:hypothetical protein